MKRWASWAIGGALIAAAWGVALITPPEDAFERPFPVTVDVGELGEGRNIAITVHDVRRAEAASAGEWTAVGNWVIVDLDAEAVVAEFGTLLNLATLEVDGRTYAASERPDSLRRGSLSVGIPRSGSLAFELPDGVDPADAVLTLGLDSDPRLDSLIVVPIDLSRIDVESDAELQPSGWSTR
jgi:hypothetical protein